MLDMRAEGPAPPRGPQEPSATWRALRRGRSVAEAGWEANVVTLTIAAVVGYLAVGRAFAYIGVPSAGVYLGEALLVGAFLFRPLRDRIVAVMSQLVDGGPFHVLMWAIVVFLGYGVVQIVYGKLQGFPFGSIILNLPFNYYAVLIPVGIAIGVLDVDLLPRLVRVLAWTNAIYGVAFMAVLQHLSIVLPWAQDVALTGPAASGLAILGLLCYEPDFRRDWYLYGANVFMLLAMQVRGEWVGFAAAFLLWSILQRTIRVGAIAVAIVAVVFSLMALLQVEIPASSTRGGTISAQGVLARSVAPFDPELASRYSDQADVFAGTASWRERWWQAIGRSVTQDSQHLIFGNGYGFELRSLVGFVEPGVRTPHSVYYYAIGYSGFLGLAAFVGLQVAILGVLARVRRLRGEVFGFLVVASGFGSAMFGNYFETPFGAIPYYLLIGLCLSTLVRPSAPAAAVAGRAVRPRRARATRVIARTGWSEPQGSSTPDAPGPRGAIGPEPTPAPVDGPPSMVGLPPTVKARMRHARDLRDRLRSRPAADLRRLARERGLLRVAARKKATLVEALEADLERELGEYERYGGGDQSGPG